MQATKKTASWVATIHADPGFFLDIYPAIPHMTHILSHISVHEADILVACSQLPSNMQLPKNPSGGSDGWQESLGIEKRKIFTDVRGIDVTLSESSNAQLIHTFGPFTTCLFHS